jgi:hypothetical protein
LEEAFEKLREEFEGQEGKLKELQDALEVLVPLSPWRQPRGKRVVLYSTPIKMPSRRPPVGD